jgi:hypothetical protein
VRNSVCAVALVSLASCGYVGPVQPPTLDIPQHVSDLRAAEFGDKIIAEFSIPLLTTEGLPLKSVDSAEIAVGVAPNPWNVNVWAASAKKYSVAATAPGPFTHDIPIADWTGKDVTLAVRATGPKGKTSDWSNLVTVPVRAALARPADLKAENVREGIQLTWSGAPGEHFHIYRASGAETPALIDSTDQPRYLDMAVDFGVDYRYYVDGFAGEQQFSEMNESEPVPRADVFPPSVPSGLTAEMGSGTIELSWERNTDPRFQGYNVYRSVNGGAVEKIASLIAAPAYSDRDVQSAKQYRYEVSAVGTNGRESARSAPVEITAQ